MIPTVSIGDTASPHVLHMLFQSHITESDLRDAFKVITQRLDDSADPMHVIVDLRARPNFLIAATVDGALTGPFRHPQMGKWLIVGQSRRGPVIEKVMCNVAKRRNVYWFQAAEDVLDYLQKTGFAVSTLD